MEENMPLPENLIGGYWGPHLLHHRRWRQEEGLRRPLQAALLRHHEKGRDLMVHHSHPSL